MHFSNGSDRKGSLLEYVSEDVNVAWLDLTRAPDGSKRPPGNRRPLKEIMTADHTNAQGVPLRLWRASIATRF